MSIHYATLPLRTFDLRQVCYEGALERCSLVVGRLRPDIVKVVEQPPKRTGQAPAALLFSVDTISQNNESGTFATEYLRRFGIGIHLPAACNFSRKTLSHRSGATPRLRTSQPWPCTFQSTPS
jgi:hypothetical protein